jgi:hypothetical protein
MKEARRIEEFTKCLGIGRVVIYLMPHVCAAHQLDLVTNNVRE